jgi:dethiobiotin synthetase
MDAKWSACRRAEEEYPNVTGLFVTGTDTNVGKTLVSCALLHAYAAAGRRVVGMKPVAAGCEPTPQGLRCDDVERLKRASSVKAPENRVNPYALVPPIAPHAAAAMAGREIRLERIRGAYLDLARLADLVVVEGVGGFRVPLNDGEDSADLAQLLDLPMVLVVGMRLGCISHALLTAEAITARGLLLVGWVANCIDPAMAAFSASLAALEQRLGAPLLGVVDYAPNVDPARVARALTLP